MRTFIIAALAAVCFAVGVMPAQAQYYRLPGIYDGGSHEPGLVPWRGPSSLGPWGIQPHHYYYGGGYRYGGGVMVAPGVVAIPHPYCYRQHHSWHIDRWGNRQDYYWRTPC